jgi:spermidine synthase
MAFPRSAFGLLFACFFLSGATALVYEVVWLRMLGLVFGHTVYAATTVLAAFMAGLGLGSLLFGRRAARFRDPIRTYGLLEIGIALYAALTPWLLRLVSSLYVDLHRALDLSYNAFSVVQFALVFSLLLVPTTLMGGTLPLLSQAVVARGEAMARPVGLLYAINTFGAMLGVALAGYSLLPWLGNRTTLMAAAAANAVVGVVAVLYALKTRSPAAKAPARAASESASADERSAVSWPVVALGVSGAASMIYEVAWTRALSLVIGSSTYAFTAMLLAFLIGIAGGAALYSWLWGRRRATLGAFAALQIAIGVAVVIALVAFERMPELFLLGMRWSDSPRFVQTVQLAISAVALLPSTLLIGATFPCAVGVVGRDLTGAGRRVGHLYAANTLGAIGGTVLGGFALVPAVGMHSSIAIGAAINFSVAAALLARPRPASALRRSAAAAAGLAGVGVLFLPIWDLRTMSSGPAVYAQRYLGAERARLGDAMQAREILFYRDGPSATVAVERSANSVALLVNGKADASTAPADMSTQLLLGHLPLLLHPAPRTVLVIGLGSGITTGAVARHPVQRLDVIEIEPGVIEASRFFGGEHGDVLRDPRVRTVVGDARSFLLTTPSRYDVITSEPSNPWIGGIASLFSVEFFRLAREHLQPGGIMLQWIHAYSLMPDDLRMVVETFRTVFPATSIWQVASGDFLLLGRPDRAPIDLHIIKSRYETYPAVRRDLEQNGLRGWSGVLGYFVLGDEDAARYAAGSAVNTDDRLSLEFSAPRALYLDTHAENARMLRSFGTAGLPEVTPHSLIELDNPEVRSWIAAARSALGAQGTPRGLPAAPTLGRSESPTPRAPLR